ncbi:unnamed protein product, partial [Strongylus vulgaris]
MTVGLPYIEHLQRNSKNVLDGIFWVEQSASTGKRELYYDSAKSPSAGRVRWAPEQSVQNCVHEYGGGSFIPLKDGSVVYSTVEGVFHQKRPDAAPKQLADANEKKLRFADFTAADKHVYCVNEAHLRPGVDPENRLISIDKETKEQKVVASGADFYASPRVSPDGKRLVWMQWNHVNMPWDETSIHMAVLHEDGTASDEVVIKDGTGKKINYYCPSWVDDKLLMVNDSTNFWNVYEVSTMGPECRLHAWPKALCRLNHIKKRTCSLLIERSATLYGNLRTDPMPQMDLAWYFDVWRSDPLYSGRLMFRRDASIRTVSTPGYTVFSHLSITQGDIDEDPAITVIRTARDDKDLESLDISEPEHIEFQSDEIPVSAWLYMPKNHNYVGPNGTLPPVL